MSGAGTEQTDTAWLQRLLQPGRPPKGQGLFLYARFDEAPRAYRYADFPALIGAKAERLRAMGVGPGDRVIVPFETDPDVIFLFLALIAMGALPLCTRPPGAIGSREAYQSYLGLLAEKHHSRWIVDLPALARYDLPLQRLPLFSEATAPDQPLVLSVPPGGPHPAGLAFVQFSSGSQSRPKGVPITHAILARNLRAIAETDGRRDSDRISTWLPLFHDMGLVGGLLSGLFSETDVHLAAPRAFLAGPLDWLRHLGDVRASGCAVPNFALEMCLRRLREEGAEDLDGVDLSGLRFIYLGSEPINMDTLDELAARLAPFGFDRRCLKPCYGMAEAVLMVSCASGGNGDDAQHGRRRIPSVGRPHPMFEVRVRDEEGAPCAGGAIGEIELRGGSLASGYFEDERAMFNDEGYYPTGDLGYFRAGELFVIGRVGDRLKINAESFFATELEHVLTQLPFVRSGRCAAVDSGGRPVVLIEATHRDVPEQSVTLRRADVTELLMRAAGIKIPPDDVLFVRPGQIEHTSSGKIRRPALTEAVASGRVALLHETTTVMTNRSTTRSTQLAGDEIT
jgi:acyl-CoA synthetase (AMP-forming)/AMP-acid ligase II